MVTRERGVSGVRRRKRRANHLKQLPVGGLVFCNKLIAFKWYLWVGDCRREMPKLVRIKCLTKWRQGSRADWRETGQGILNVRVL